MTEIYKLASRFYCQGDKHLKKKKRKNKVKRSWILDVPIGVSALFIIMGIVLGVVLVSITWREGKLIDKSEAISECGIYESYIKHHSARGSLNEIEIRFYDRERLYINAAYWDADIEVSLDKLDSGERLYMLVHPCSEYIWEIETETETLLHFEDAKHGTYVENIGFSIILGTFGCITLVMGSVSLILQLSERRKGED